MITGQGNVELIAAATRAVELPELPGPMDSLWTRTTAPTACPQSPWKTLRVSHRSLEIPAPTLTTPGFPQPHSPDGDQSNGATLKSRTKGGTKPLNHNPKPDTFNQESHPASLRSDPVRLPSESLSSFVGIRKALLYGLACSSRYRSNTS